MYKAYFYIPFILGFLFCSMISGVMIEKVEHHRMCGNAGNLQSLLACTYLVVERVVWLPYG